MILRDVLAKRVCQTIKRIFCHAMMEESLFACCILHIVCGVIVKAVDILSHSTVDRSVASILTV